MKMEIEKHFLRANFKSQNEISYNIITKFYPLSLA